MNGRAGNRRLLADLKESGKCATRLVGEDVCMVQLCEDNDRIGDPGYSSAA